MTQDEPECEMVIEKKCKEVTSKIGVTLSLSEKYLFSPASSRARDSVQKTSPG